MITGLFADKPVYRKFFILVFVISLSTILFSMLGGLLADHFYGVNVLSDPKALSNLEDPLVMSAMKLLQILTTGFGMFLIPAILAAILFSTKPRSYLSATKMANPLLLGLTLLLTFSAVPFINSLLIFNQQLHLPEFLSGVESWMRASEDNAARITEMFLKMDTSLELLFNLFIVALLPALGEELLFRGVLQRLFKELTNNIHVAIILTSILFSAIHMQFFGFIPRMLLGMLFGYLLHWTGSIWVPIFAHLVNNGAAVIFAYYAGNNQLPFNQDTIGTENGEWPYVIISLALIFGLGFLIKKLSTGNITEETSS
ncbi:MAG: CPBP family intramembrane metalloprotease [Bacteroidetes bacterium]|nr:CPBP family intramembrane metalloprotease [Bacteroidota bacterium]